MKYLKNYTENKKSISFLCFVLFLCAPSATYATTLKDDFTGNTTSIPWLARGDACLTDGSGNESTIPACDDSQTNLGYPMPIPTGSNQAGDGALQLSSGGPDSISGGEAGAIIDPQPFPFSNGLTVTFNTFTFGGNGLSGGNGGNTGVFNNQGQNVSLSLNSGADGIGFYIINAAKVLNSSGQVYPDAGTGTTSNTFHLGSSGGSLSYACSNYGNAGMPGAYLGLGIDEFGNYVNPNNDTNTGPGFASNSIGLRGYGDIAYYNVMQALGISGNLQLAYGADVVGQACQDGGVIADIKNICTGGYYYEQTNTYPYYKQVCSQYNSGQGMLPSDTNQSTTVLPDYNYINGSFTQLPASKPIFNLEKNNGSYPPASEISIKNAIPISYKLNISPQQLLSLSYSYNNGSFINIINNQPISGSVNGSFPQNVLFGFGASTGSGTNFHEITCFRAGPANQSASSASVDLQQTGELQTNSQVFLAYYSPENWWGRLTAQQIETNSTTGAVSVNPEVNWDAACELTGGICSSQYDTANGYTQPTASTPAQLWSGISALTWSGTSGIPLNWSALNTQEQGWLNGDASTSQDDGQELLHYLKGDTNHDASSYTGSGSEFRNRTEILGDIINSSPTWVGGPISGLPNQFSNSLYPRANYSENSGGSESYSTFESDENSRLNVVYIGANDGLLHGFSAGNFNANGTFNPADNNGSEVFAYMPYAVLQSFNTEVNTSNDYAFPQYGHNFYVNATPSTKSVFYLNKWHTLLVGALGEGGRGLFALNITHPSKFSSTNTNDVLADYTFANKGLVPSNSIVPSPANFTVINGPSANANYRNLMGNIEGKPIIRLMNNGDYAIISGNGIQSDDGEAGIFIFLINPTTGISKTLFLGTGQGSAASPDGIDYVSSADLNNNHFADYLYAGDTNGNVWRFNVTSNNSSNWHTSYYGNGTTPTPLFSSGTTQPITTKILINSNIAPNGIPQVMLQFGTGNTTPLTNSSPATYSKNPQSIYDIWDGGFSQWNKMTGASIYNDWPQGSFQTITPSQLVLQNITQLGRANNGDNAINISDNSACWAGNPGCTGSSAQYGSQLKLPSFKENGETLYEQVTYNPDFVEGSAIFDTTIPPYNNAFNCSSGLQNGYTIALNTLTGGSISSGFFRISGTNGDINSSGGGELVTLNGSPASGLQLNATGSPSIVFSKGIPLMVQQTVSGSPTVNEISPETGAHSQVNWIQLR